MADSNGKTGEMITVNDMCEFNDNGAIVSVGLIKEHPNSLYVARKVFRLSHPESSSNIGTAYTDDTFINSIVDVLDITKFNHLPLKDKYMSIIRANSMNSKMFAFFKKYMGSLLPDTVSEMRSFEYTKHYGGSYSSPRY